MRSWRCARPAVSALRSYWNGRENRLSAFDFRLSEEPRPCSNGPGRRGSEDSVMNAPAQEPSRDSESRTPNAESRLTGAALRLFVEPDGIALLLLDVPGEPVNTLYPELGREMEQRMAEIEADPRVRAVVFASGKKDSFFAGAKIDMLSGIRTAEEAAQLSRGAHRSMAKLEGSMRPVVAAIHGACLGGGLETVLACHYRIASDDRKTVLGAPETMLGLIPGAGGTQRIPRLVGIAAALDLVLTGRQLKADKALKLGLVDEVVPNTILLDVARRRARELADGTIPRVRPRPKKKLQGRLTDAALEENPVGRRILFRQARARLLRKSGGHYPAPERAIDVIREGAEHGFEAGLAAEARAFGELVVSDVSKRLVGIFFAHTALKKDPGTDDAAAKALPVRKLGIIGGGLMGSGIAYVGSAVAGCTVRMREKDDEALGRALAAAAGLVDERLKKRRISRLERDRQVARISGGTGWDGFGRADLVVEAVFEDLALKRRILAECEARMSEHAVFASNTSSLPIARIAEGAKRPERVLGMHYFSPVNKMPLLEVIVHPGTAPEATATAVAAGKAQGKTVIVVRDGPGFYTTRILAPYLNEAVWLLAEGAAVDDVDAALVKFGFPVGPYALLDEVGIDVGAKVGHVLYEAFGERLKAPDGQDRAVQEGRLGRKAKKGFYLYDAQGRSRKDGGRKPVDPTVYDSMPGGRARRRMPADEVAQRLALQMVNEAALCLQEGILRSARDGDIGAIFGLGFPPFLGGPFRYADSVGAAELVRRLEGFEKKHGVRFRAAPLLVEQARTGAKFHAA